VAPRKTRKGNRVLIGIEPHKGSHTAVVVDRDEVEVARVKVRADRHQLARLLEFAAPYGPRTWAIESAGGLGYLLAQQLVAAGEPVIDVPATLASRVRLLGSGRGSKNDPNDALSTAIAALRHPDLRHVAKEDHAQVLALLARRHKNLTSLRTQAICRLHAELATLMPGGMGRSLTAAKAATALARIRPATAVETARRQLAADLLADVRRLDVTLAENTNRIRTAVKAAGTTVTDVYGVGPRVAALVLGQTGDVRRFRSPDHYAAYNGTAPLEASSGPRVRHRLNPRGNRQLNHAMHRIAVTQIRNDTAGRAYYDRKVAEGKSHKEALRALKRRVSDAVYRQLVADANTNDSNDLLTN
jgi:transposase